MAHSKQELIHFTKFVDSEKKTAKSYGIVDGKLVKAAFGNFFKGSFETASIPYGDLPDYIGAMVPGEFIVQGIHQTLISGSCPGDATRAKALFPFSERAGVLVIDTDSIDKFTGIDSLDDLISALNTIDTALTPAMKYCASSASSYIEYAGINSGLRGVHTYIPIDCAISNGTILECLHACSVLAGFGYASVTKDGKILIKSLIDTALKTSNQPIFEGGAILNDPAITQDSKRETYNGDMLAAASVIPLSEREKTDYDAIVARLKSKVSKAAGNVRCLYITTKAKEIKDESNALTVRLSEGIVRKAISDNILYGQFFVQLETGESVSIQDILDHQEKYHEISCAHPLDVEIHGKSIIYSDQENPLIHTFANGGGVFYLKSTIAEWRLLLDEHVANFNETHAQVILSGKHKIMRSVHESVGHDGRVTYEYINLEDLKKLYANDSIQTNEKMVNNVLSPVYKDKISAWQSHGDCRIYRGGVVFNPAGGLPVDYYNLWQGFAIAPINGMSTALITDHIVQVVCNGDSGLSEYFLNWVAFTMQNPEVPVGVALVLRGEKGSGKGLIGHFLRKIWGNHGMQISNPEHLVGRFNSHLADLCFLFADEAFFSGNKQHEGILKSLITEPTNVIERKGIDAITQANYLKIFMATNSDFAVPASKDERRYGVFDVSSARIGDTEYFNALLSASNDASIQSAFLYEMLHRDLSDFSVRVIPETQGLKDQRLHSLPSQGEWLAECLAKGFFNRQYQYEYTGEHNKWEQELSAAGLHASYIEWCNINKKTQWDRVTINVLGKYLGNIYNRKKLKGGIRGYVLGSLHDAIVAFETYEKVDLDIERDMPVPAVDEPFREWRKSSIAGSVINGVGYAV